MMRELHKRLISMEAACVYLDISFETLKKHIKSGEIPVVREIGNGARLSKIDVRDLDEWIEKRKERLL